MTAKEKSREIRFRRMAKRQGLELKKSRRRDPNAIEYGGYILVNTRTDEVVLGQDEHSYQATLEDVEDYLTGEREYDDNNLLERAKNHKTVVEGRNILLESFEALKSGSITIKESKEISRIISKATEKAMKDIKNGKETNYLQDK